MQWTLYIKDIRTGAEDFDDEDDNLADVIIL